MSSTNRKRRLDVRRMLGPVLVLSLFFLSRSADARPEFPDELAKHWNMQCTPGCAVCHLDARGGPGNIRNTTNGNPGFGAMLRDAYNLDKKVVSSLDPALDADKADNSDVDGDGKTDFQELSAGEDPNDPTPGASVCGGGGPEFGCVRVAKRGPVDGVAALAFATTLLIGVARLRRRASR